MNDLRKIGRFWLMVVSCVQDNAKLVDHLLLRCKMAQFLWTSALRWFKCSLICPYDLHQLFEACSMVLSASKGRVMRRLSFLVLIRILWKERNMQCFKGKPSTMDILFEQVRFYVALWASTLPLLQDIPSETILRYRHGLI